ncbi:MAG: hypothetical protein PWQ20_1022 [Thermotogaceae bacterium]|nr:hypothetical protein [Thermotogaceae bacterium]
MVRGNIFINLTNVFAFEIFVFLYSFMTVYLPKESYSLFVKIGAIVVATGAFVDLTSNFSTHLDPFENHNQLHNVMFVSGGVFLITGFILSLLSSYKQKLILKAFINSYKEVNLDANLKDFLEKLLESLIHSIPNAKKGSVLVKEGNHYVFKAALGYDFEKLKDIQIELNEFPDARLTKVKLIKKINQRSDRLPDKILQQLLKIQDFRIKSTIVIPAKKNEVFFYVDFEQGIPRVKGIYGDMLESMRIFIASLIEKYEMYQQLRQIYDKDPLTNTYSRTGIDKILVEIEENPNGNVLVIVDIDGLKKVNDTYGHKTGDEFLRFFVKELRRMLRISDKIIRFGGDEFLIVMENCTLSNAIEKMHNIEEKIGKTGFFVRESNVLLPISFSYGMSFLPSKKHFDKAVLNADRELYEMKARKKQSMTND